MAYSITCVDTGESFVDRRRTDAAHPSHGSLGLTPEKISQVKSVIRTI